MLSREQQKALSDFVAAAAQAQRADIRLRQSLPSAVGREHHIIAADLSGGPHAGRHLLVLRGDAADAGGLNTNGLVGAEEFAIRAAVFEAGLTTPQPLWLEPSGEVIGKPFMILRHIAGTADAADLQRDLSAEAGDRLAYRLGQELARLHQTTMNAAPADLAFLPQIGEGWAKERVDTWRAMLDSASAAQPTLEWAMNWFVANAPAISVPALCHRDLRLGNFVADGEKLMAILDLERVGWSDPMEDLGWLCARGARLGMPDREAGGIGSRESLYDGYKDVSGRVVDDRRVRFWEIAAAIRQGVTAVARAHHQDGDVEQGLRAALVGMQAIEAEYDLLTEIELYTAESAS